MKATIKTIGIEKLAEELNGTLWIKGDFKRIYLNEVGYNTKKMSTKVYVYEKDQQFYVNVKIECPSQAPQWIDSQENEIFESISTRVSEIIEEFGYEIENPAIEKKAALDSEEQVQGYYMRWHEVRVAINSYGKLAYRKRQKVHTYKGAISKVPSGFVSLNDEQYAKALDYEVKERLYEYGETPNFN